MTPSTGNDKPRIPVWKMLLLPANLFTNNMTGGALLVAVVPMQILAMVGSEWKGTAQGLTLALGIGIGLISGPMAGTLSDQVRNRYIGRRKPFIILSVLFRALLLILLSIIGSLGEWRWLPVWLVMPLYSLVFALVHFCDEFCDVPLRAVIADISPKEQYGVMSGLFSISDLIGGLFGSAVIGSFYPMLGPIALCTIVAILTLFGCLLTSIGLLHEPEPTTNANNSSLKQAILTFFHPFLQSRDFRLIFCVSLLFYFGINMIQLLSLYLLIDVVRVYTFFGMFTLFTEPTIANGVLLVILFVGAILSGFGSGFLSDLFGRKIFVYLSCALFVGGGIGMIVAGYFSYVVMAGFAFVMGIGIGGYGSVGFALATEILPNKDTAAKDLALYSLSGSIAQAIATPVAGVTLDMFNHLGALINFGTLGYVVVWIISSVVVTLAAFVSIWISKGKFDSKKLRQRFSRKSKTPDAPSPIELPQQTAVKIPETPSELTTPISSPTETLASSDSNNLSTV